MPNSELPERFKSFVKQTSVSKSKVSLFTSLSICDVLRAMVLLSFASFSRTCHSRRSLLLEYDPFVLLQEE
jgi:hypothetical protein